MGDIKNTVQDRTYDAIVIGSGNRRIARSGRKTSCAEINDSDGVVAASEDKPGYVYNAVSDNCQIISAVTVISASSPATSLNAPNGML